MRRPRRKKGRREQRVKDTGMRGCLLAFNL
jgi:hypothetical protein